MERRSFLKASAALGCAATVTGCKTSSDDANVTPTPPPVADEQMNWSACLVNCGSNCPIKVFSRDGVITRIEADHETTDEYGVNHQIRACARGRSLKQRTYAPDRLKTPMKRIGNRGEGKFVPISWDDAYAEIAAKLQETASTHGNESIYFNYGTGAYYGFANNNATWGRLLNLNGGFLNHHWDYSWSQVYMAAMATYGDKWDSIGGSSLAEIENSDLFIGFGFNPNEIRQSGSGEGYDFIKALENNKHSIEVYMVEPRYTDSMRGNEHKWLAVRPGTDAALAEAVIHHMIDTGWVNDNSAAFLESHCVGYSKASLERLKAELEVEQDQNKREHAQYINPEDNYHDYIMGMGKYLGQGARTPEWAEKICGVTADNIRELATKLMNAKAPYISAGAGVSRHANGDQNTRAVYMLSIMTGKLGQAGVSTGAMPSSNQFPLGGGLPAGNNPVDITIPCFSWSDAIVRGEEFTGTTDGVRYASNALNEIEDNNSAKLNSNIKVIINTSSNILINQHSDSNGTAEILADESKCELIVVCDCWMTPSARYADIILPDTTWLESEDLADDSYASGQMAYATMMSSSLNPLGDAKSMYDICAGIADKMGKGGEYTEGKTGRDWCEEIYAGTRAANTDVDMPATYGEAQEVGLFRKYMANTVVALKDYVANPAAAPRPTISGKIEIYSVSLAKKAATWTLLDGDEITPLPKYVVTWDGFEDEEAAKDYPLQLCGFHTKGRTHSSYHNVPWLREAVEDAVWMNPKDANARGITQGAKAQVWNDRGTIELPVRVTPRVAPGVAMVGQGAWYTPDPAGRIGNSGHIIDIGGCINTLTKYHPTPVTKGNPQHTNRVQIATA
ncbi:molybdopterin-dependent oxidoreductase [Shewanella sp. 5_MG-2023]|uniref:DMSO/selenate family reductase complex A subunit n=1 Tax=Shewanella sp. 5_MG-2023 TaxID=3062656 RepID=UPI0026E2EE11|nr:DMSO/selenate family reductase complex A subunit [Shewanella sp. 5_MG-2023]MDO6639609.1 molybdopterin-dependent oxidoreductase [Shewanella sp. 5_MG-2023]